MISFRKVLRALVLLLAAISYLHVEAQTDPTPAAKQLFEQERWPDLVQLLQQSPRNSADLDYYYGVALAHLERWEEAGRRSPMGSGWLRTISGFPSNWLASHLSRRNMERPGMISIERCGLIQRTNTPMNFWRRFISFKAIWKRRSSIGTA